MLVAQCFGTTDSNGWNSSSISSVLASWNDETRLLQFYSHWQLQIRNRRTRSHSVEHGRLPVQPYSFQSLVTNFTVQQCVAKTHHGNNCCTRCQQLMRHLRPSSGPRPVMPATLDHPRASVARCTRRTLRSTQSRNNYTIANCSWQQQADIFVMVIREGFSRAVNTSELGCARASSLRISRGTESMYLPHLMEHVFLVCA